MDFLRVSDTHRCTACNVVHPIGTVYLAHNTVAANGPQPPGGAVARLVEGDRVYVNFHLAQSGSAAVAATAQMHLICEQDILRRYQTSTIINCASCNINFQAREIQNTFEDFINNLFARTLYFGMHMTSLFHSDIVGLGEHTLQDLQTTYLRSPETRWLPNRRTCIQIALTVSLVAAAALSCCYFAGAAYGLLIAGKFSVIAWAMSVEALVTATTVIAKLAAITRIACMSMLLVSAFLAPMVGLLVLYNDPSANGRKTREKIKHFVTHYPMAHIFTAMMLFPSIFLKKNAPAPDLPA